MKSIRIANMNNKKGSRKQKELVKNIESKRTDLKKIEYYHQSLGGLFFYYEVADSFQEC